jgi:hypothetical protein
MALAPIGRAGIVNSARKLSGFTKTGWRTVLSTADFQQGMVADMDSSGNAAVADTSSQKLLGIFNCHKASKFYKPIVEESVTFTGAGSEISLKHKNIRTGYYVVTNTAKDTVYVETTDYDIDKTNGTLTEVSIGATATVLISYLYEDTNIAALDMTGPQLRASVIEGSGEIALSIYDINKVNSSTGKFAVNLKVSADSNGLVTTGGSYGLLGYVTKVPTSTDPELYIMQEVVNYSS